MRFKTQNKIRTFVLFFIGVFLSCSSSDNQTIQWGAFINIEDNTTRIEVVQNLGVNYARMSTTIVTYSGKLVDMERFQKVGIHVLLNILYEPNTTTPRTFPTDMTTYKQKLSAILDQYQPEVLSIENEPANQQYYIDDMSNYITELQAAIEVAHSHGAKIADGGLHVNAVDAIIENQVTSEVIEREQELLEKYTSLDLDYINLHMDVGTKGLGDATSFPEGLLQKVSDYVVAKTGHSVICNAFTIQPPATSATLASVVSEFKKTNTANGQFKYALIYSDSNGKVEPLNNGVELTDLGNDFKTYIQ